MDRLNALLARFSVQAHMFHSGALCGSHDFAEHSGVGQLHLIQRGAVEAYHGGARPQQIVEPSVVLYPRPLAHRFITDPERGADMACANLRFSADSINPLAQALPAVVVLPLAQLTGAQPLLDLLFSEAFTPRCGGRQVVDRLFEVTLILIVRALLDRGEVEVGLLAGLSDPRLSKALVAIHESPAHGWNLRRLAAAAGMSRSHFAASFHETVGQTPGDYLARYRICVAQDLLRLGKSLQQAADAVGYGSASALSRAFTRYCGHSPREWRAAGLRLAIGPDRNH